MLPILGLVLVIAGAVGLWLPQSFADAQPISATQSAPVPTPSVKASSFVISGHPSRIRIPNQNIDIEVIDGIYNPQAKTWTLTPDKAQFAVMTPEPNNSAGNTFIYGHNTKQVFARLLSAKAGDLAIVETSNGHKFTYQLNSSRQTVPTDDSLFEYQGPPILTLQTCSGANFQYRYLLTFQLVEAV